jgi:hypothetical protein
MNTLYTFGCSFTEDFENIPEFLHDGGKPAQLRYVDQFLLSNQFDFNRNIRINEIFRNNGVITVSEETNEVVMDAHYSKIGHQKIGELFYDHIIKYTK